MASDPRHQFFLAELQKLGGKLNKDKDSMTALEKFLDDSDVTLLVASQNNQTQVRTARGKGCLVDMKWGME